jgi:hypothetical protein
MGVLVVLTAAAPGALACHCLPQLDGVARLWWRTLFGTLGVQVLQALTLRTGVRVFLDPDASIPAMLGMGAGGVVNLAVLVAMLWTCVRIPALMRRHVLRGGNPAGIGTYLIRVVLVQQLARGVLPRGTVNGRDALCYPHPAACCARSDPQDLPLVCVSSLASLRWQPCRSRAR